MSRGGRGEGGGMDYLENGIYVEWLGNTLFRKIEKIEYMARLSLLGHSNEGFEKINILLI
jgi:hypothetical protein